MDWRGLEWAVPVFEISALLVPVIAFVVLYRRARRGALNRPGAFWRYAVVVLAPTIVYCLFFVALIGVEQVAHASVITEGLARSFLILVGLGLAVWFVSTVVFGVALLLSRNP